MSSEAVQALLQTHEDQEEHHKLQGDRRQGSQALKLNHLNSIEIIKYAVKIIQVTPRLYSILLSLLPFYALMIAYEIIIPIINDHISMILVPYAFSWIYEFNNDEEQYKDLNIPTRNVLLTLLELFPLYFVLLPLLEFFSLFMIIDSAQKIYEGEKLKSSTLNKGTNNIWFFYKRGSLKGPFIVTLLVQLLTICALAGLFSTVTDHLFIAYWISPKVDYDNVITLSPTNDHILLPSIAFHSLIFVAVLYEYLEWSASWNMGVVISVLQREVVGVYALETSAYYGRHCKRTGLQLMLVFVVHSVAIRLPFLFARMFDDVSVRVVVAGFVSFLVCLGSLVKWIAFVVYYNDCKAQMMPMKVNEKVDELSSKYGGTSINC